MELEVEVSNAGSFREIHVKLGKGRQTGRVEDGLEPETVSHSSFLMGMMTLQQIKDEG